MATLASLGAGLPGRPLDKLLQAGGRAGNGARRALSVPAGGARRALSGPTRWALMGALDEALSALDVALNSSLAQEVLDRILASQLTDDVLDRVLGQALNSPDAERLVGRVIDSRVVDAAVVRLLDTEGLWVLVDEIAGSPAVTAAISQQGIGFANQVAGAMRDRSRTADDRVERIARRFTRRAKRDGAGSDGTAVSPSRDTGAASPGPVSGTHGPRADAPGPVAGSP